MPALASVVMAGCFFPADRGRVVENRLDALQGDNVKLRAELAETRTKVEETTAQLQTALDQLDRASRTTGANMGVKVDGAMQDIAVLRGQVESQQVKIQELETKLAEAKTAVATTPTPTEPKKDEPKRPDDPKEFLKLADDKSKAGEVELARKLYAEFIKKWPRDDGVGKPTSRSASSSSASRSAARRSTSSARSSRITRPPSRRRSRTCAAPTASSSSR
ncbi:MAG: hypothetical protein U0228_17315 [Myxococcaceae bacterium]